jgi:hypothetical protein
MLSPIQCNQKANIESRSNIALTCIRSSPLMHRQALRSEAHGQQLLQRKHCGLSILVIHQNRHRRLKCHHQVSFNSASRSSLPLSTSSIPLPRLTSQNSRIYCLHMPQGLAGGEMSVATARARISPRRAPSTTAVPRAVRSAQVPTG